MWTFFSAIDDNLMENKMVTKRGTRVVRILKVHLVPGVQRIVGKSYAADKYYQTLSTL